MKKLILFGAGTYGKRWMHKIGEDNVFMFADSDPSKCGNLYCGKKIASKDELRKLKDEIVIFIATSGKYKQEIKSQLEEAGLGNCIVKTPYPGSISYIDLDADIDQDTILEGKNVVWSSTVIRQSILGYGSYVGGNSYLSMVKIGRYTSIGSNVSIIRGQHPVKKIVSTYPGFYSNNNESVIESYVDANIFDEFRYVQWPYAVMIGNDVWIGSDVRIMEGVRIADGTVVAAGTMLVKSTEPYDIVGGNPGQKIGTRFSDEEKEFLLNFEWWNKSEEWLQQYAQYFGDIEEFMKKMKTIEQG